MGVLLALLKKIDRAAHMARYPFSAHWVPEWMPDWVHRVHLVRLSVPVFTATLVDRVEDHVNPL